MCSGVCFICWCIRLSVIKIIVHSLIFYMFSVWTNREREMDLMTIAHSHERRTILIDIDWNQVAQLNSHPNVNEQIRRQRANVDYVVRHSFVHVHWSPFVWSFRTWHRCRQYGILLFSTSIRSQIGPRWAKSRCECTLARTRKQSFAHKDRIFFHRTQSYVHLNTCRFAKAHRVGVQMFSGM